MDGEAGWWTTSGKIGLPPLARVMGVGRQQQHEDSNITCDEDSNTTCDVYSNTTCDEDLNTICDEDLNTTCDEH